MRRPRRRPRRFATIPRGSLLGELTIGYRRVVPRRHVRAGHVVAEARRRAHASHRRPSGLLRRGRDRVTSRRRRHDPGGRVGEGRFESKGVSSGGRRYDRNGWRHLGARRPGAYGGFGVARTDTLGGDRCIVRRRAPGRRGHARLGRRRSSFTIGRNHGGSCCAYVRGHGLRRLGRSLTRSCGNDRSGRAVGGSNLRRLIGRRRRPVAAGRARREWLPASRWCASRHGRGGRRSGRRRPSRNRG